MTAELTGLKEDIAYISGVMQKVAAKMEAKAKKKKNSNEKSAKGCKCELVAVKQSQAKQLSNLNDEVLFIFKEFLFFLTLNPLV